MASSLLLGQKAVEHLVAEDLTVQKKDIKLFIIWIFLATSVCAWKLADAQVIFLDNRTGVVNGATNYDPATRAVGSGSYKVFSDPWDASQSLHDGDTLYFREGEYYSDVRSKPGYEWYYGSLKIDVSNVTIRNYNNEICWLKGGPSRVTPQYHPNNALTFAGSNNVIDGLYIFGGTIFCGVSNTMKNCDLSGGWDHQGPWMAADAGWPNCIRFVSSKNALVQNCRIHDNIMQAGNASNMAIIMHEKDDNTVVENCEFYNTAAAFIYLKYQAGYNNSPLGTGTHATYRYNYFRGPNGGIELVAGVPVSGLLQKQVFYQNIFRECKTSFASLFAGNGELFAFIYNNTFVNVKDGVVSNWGSVNNYNFFNNILYWNKDMGTVYYWRFDDPRAPISSYIDYNDFFATAESPTWFHNYAVVASTVSSWRSYTAGLGSQKDTYSLSADPVFINSSGSQTADFRRSSYPANGRGGGWSNIMGAYITGNETIGLYSGTPPPPTTKSPNPPTSLLIQ